MLWFGNIHKVLGVHLDSTGFPVSIGRRLMDVLSPSHK